MSRSRQHRRPAASTGRAPMPLPPDGLMLRPSLARYREQLGLKLVIPVLALAALVVLAVVAPRWLLPPVGPLLALVLVCVCISMAYTRWAHVTVTTDDVRATGFLGRRRHWARAQIASTLHIGALLAAGPYVVEVLYLLDDDGRKLLRLTSGFWDPSTLDALASALDVPTHRLESTTPKQLRERYPNLVSWAGANPVKVGLIGAAAVFVVVVPVAAVIAVSVTS